MVNNIITHLREVVSVSGAVSQIHKQNRKRVMSPTKREARPRTSICCELRNENRTMDILYNQVLLIRRKPAIIICKRRG